jgi:hypothetical protein
MLAENLALVGNYGEGHRERSVAAVPKKSALRHLHRLAWLVRPGKKGHFPEDLYVTVVQQVHKLLPPGAQVVFLGDGEFDGITLQRTVQTYHWSYVVRTGSHITVLWAGDHCRCETVDACIKPGTLVELRDVCVTEAAYGPIMLLCCWAKGYKDPPYL